MNVEPVVARLPGNVAKYRLLLDLRETLRSRPGARVLDVGCVGPGRPLELWSRLLEDSELDFTLTGVDILGLARAREALLGRPWVNRVRLVEGTAYNLERVTGGERFQVIVSTQVFEHLARYRRGLAEMARVAAPGASILLTMDSAHFGGKFPAVRPWIWAKRVVKKLLALLGNERHYDIPLYDRDVEGELDALGLELVEKRYHNLGELKWLHNHRIASDDKDRFLERCWELEEIVNRAPSFGMAEKSLFRCLYFHLLVSQRT